MKVREGLQGSDEEGAAKEEEAEARRLQQAAAANLRPEDFGLDALGSDDEASSSGEDEEGEAAAGTMAAAADQARQPTIPLLLLLSFPCGFLEASQQYKIVKYSSMHFAGTAIVL